MTVPLVAENDMVVGTVTAAIDSNELVVTYALSASWSMTESQLDIETDVGLIPQIPKSNPVPGHFAFNTEHSPAVAEYTYHKPISWQPGDTLYIAAHAEVQRSGDCAETCPPPGDDDDREGAWAAGTRFTPRGSRAMYVTFRPTVQAVVSRGDKWQLTRVAGQTTDGTTALFDDSLYMLQDAAGIAEAPLPADIQADLADDPTSSQQFTAASQTVISEIVTSEQIGKLTPALEAIAEPLDPQALANQNMLALFGRCASTPIARNATINLDGFNFPLFAGALSENVNANLSISGHVSAAVTLELHLLVKRFRLFGACIPYGITFDTLHVSGNATLDYAATLAGTVTLSESFEKELLKLGLFDVWFQVGPVPVRIAFNLPISVGADLTASAAGSLSYDSGHRATGSLDYTCTSGGCRGTSSFQPFESSVPATLTGSISGRLQPSVWAEAAFRGALYSDSLAYAQVGVRPFLHGDLWGFSGNDCGDGDGDGVNETVTGLTFDLDSEITANVAGGLFGAGPSRHDLLTTGRHHLKFFDLIGSSALSPTIQGNPNATAGQLASYTVSMRPCWPYTDEVSHTITWGDGSSEILSASPPAGASTSHAWQQVGTYSLTATSLRDAHGRSLNRSTSRDIAVTAISTGSNGNPFTYSRPRDQQLTCFGIAFTPDFPSNCRDIADFDDKQMCSGMSSLSQDPCRSITDSDLQLACLAMTVAPNSPSICGNITDPQMQNFCFGVSSGGSMPNCNNLTDSNTRALCIAMAIHDPSTCSSITNTNDRLFCLGVASRSQDPCVSIQ